MQTPSTHPLAEIIGRVYDRVPESVAYLEDTGGGIINLICEITDDTGEPYTIIIDDETSPDPDRPYMYGIHYGHYSLGDDADAKYRFDPDPIHGVVAFGIVDTALCQPAENPLSAEAAVDILAETSRGGTVDPLYSGPPTCIPHYAIRRGR